jgi:hypothetical protein
LRVDGCGLVGAIYDVSTGKVTFPAGLRAEASRKKACEILGDDLRQSLQSRLALRLYLKYGSQRPTIWVVAAEREHAGRFIVCADEKLTAFIELESAIYARFRFARVGCFAAQIELLSPTS